MATQIDVWWPSEIDPETQRELSGGGATVICDFEQIKACRLLAKADKSLWPLEGKSLMHSAHALAAHICEPVSLWTLEEGRRKVAMALEDA